MLLQIACDFATGQCLTFEVHGDLVLLRDSEIAHRVDDRASDALALT